MNNEINQPDAGVCPTWLPQYLAMVEQVACLAKCAMHAVQVAAAAEDEPSDPQEQ